MNRHSTTADQRRLAVSGDMAEALRGASVLYVEDDDDVREQLAQFLARRVGTLYVAANGQEGLDRWRAERPDVVVTDIMMPVMDGLAMAEAIRRECPAAPIIITTAYNESEHFLRAIDLGIDKYVVKPINVELLERALRKSAWEARANLELKLAATVFAASSNAILVTDAKNRIVAVNGAFCEITGYAESEALGQSPGMLASGRHDAAFYAEMNRALQHHGSWSGEIWNRRKNGDLYAEWLTINAVREGQGDITHYVAIFSDITQRKADEEEIKHLAFYDPLTGLPNRRLLLDRLHQATAASRRSHRRCALLFIDLDNFKNLNDTLGHEMGDLLLQRVAGRLSECVREGDTVARLGGDEFVVMLEDLGDNDKEALARTETVAQKILTTLGTEYLIGGAVCHSTPSIGVALFHDQERNLGDLLKQADMAMYQAKAAGRNAIRFFDPQMQAVVVARAELESDLRRALREDQLVLYFQPQVGADRCPIGAEALVRWRHPQRGLIAPLQFIPLAEETGLILPLGQWVLEAACEQIARWAPRYEKCKFHVAVNVSARQFHHADFVEQVEGALRLSGADPRCLKIELTESVLLDDVDVAVAKMTALRERGVSFSLDDFGTGYSSLSYLKRLPLDQIKIDRSFVSDVLVDSNDAAIARTILALGKSLGLDVIAEGVETDAQRTFLASHGCDGYQGYLFGRPMPAEEFHSA